VAARTRGLYLPAALVRQRCRRPGRLLRVPRVCHRSQLGYIIPLGELQGYVNLKAYKEFSAEHRADGWNAWLTFSISPAASSAPPPTQRRVVTK
jgi:hypothetical protein